MSRYRILVLATVLGLAACGDRNATATTDEADPVVATEAAQAPTPPEAEVATDASPAAPADSPLQPGDIDAYVSGMGKEVELLEAQFRKVEQARADGNQEAATTALFAMTSGDIDRAGAAAAGMDPARYGFVKNRIDEVQSKLDLLEGFRKSGTDTTALQAQLGDPYAGLADGVASALRQRQSETAALRAQAMGLRIKAAGN